MTNKTKKETTITFLKAKLLQTGAIIIIMHVSYVYILIDTGS